jgi:hypothetical protein
MGGGVLAHSSPRIPGGADLGDDDDAGGSRFRAAMRRPRQERARAGGSCSAGLTIRSAVSVFHFYFFNQK